MHSQITSLYTQTLYPRLSYFVKVTPSQAELCSRLFDTAVPRACLQQTRLPATASCRVVAVGLLLLADKEACACSSCSTHYSAGGLCCVASRQLSHNRRSPATPAAETPQCSGVGMMFFMFPLQPTRSSGVIAGARPSVHTQP